MRLAACGGVVEDICNLPTSCVFVDVDLCDLWRCGREELKHTNELRFFVVVVALCDLRRRGRGELKLTNESRFSLLMPFCATCGVIVERS